MSIEEIEIIQQTENLYYVRWLQDEVYCRTGELRMIQAYRFAKTLRDKHKWWKFWT